MPDDSTSVIPMIETAHDIVSISKEVIAALEADEVVSKDVLLIVMHSQVEAFTVLLEHHLKVVDMLEELIATVQAAAGEEQ
jgi:hypothetical protein